MFYCNNCGYEFLEADTFIETHGLSSPPYEKLSVCPSCKSGSISEKSITHCRCCGARLSSENSEYCSITCKERGERLREKERKKRNIRIRSPINKILRQVAEYNKANHTNYSYGQFVALILPKLKKDEKKCQKKKRNT